MLHLPGYTLRGAIKATSTNLIFHAVRDADGLPLILKTPAAHFPNQRELERYRREFGILQRLQDVRGVTRVHACEHHQERPVLLLEEVEGEPLSELTGRPFEVIRALDLALSLASTLAELHRHGVIHKDLKPSNIIVTPSGDTRLIDFGTATLQLVEHVDAAPAALIEGTLAYMSPEQTGRMNRPVDSRTDLYSLGVTLYELLTGSRPFHGRDALEWFHAHMAQAPQSPLERVPGLPPVLSAIVLKLLAKVAEERYQSADGLQADLERCRNDLLRGVHEDFPLGVHDAPTHFQLPQRLYGRGSEAAVLHQGFERVAQSGRPELILVHGYSGIGKSTVVNELHKPVVRQRGFFLGGKFEQFQRDIPYATLAQAIRDLTQQLLASTDEELARWSAHLNEAWEGQGQVLVDVVPQLGLVAGKQPPVQELPPTEAQHRFHRVFRKLLGVFATPEHPLVVFLDDLQWADLASLQFIHHLLTHPETPPVLLIGAYRDNEVGPTHPLAHTLEGLRKAGARMTDLQLEPLSLDEVRQLVADTLPGAGPGIVEPLAALARDKTGGNPFFLLRFLRTLNQDRLLRRTPEGAWSWDAEATRARGYSDNVVDFMAGKLRQLPMSTQHLLRLAACVGNAFTLQMLGLISHMPEPSEVEQGLEPALQEGMLVRASPEQYRFLHDRIQQAARALIPEAERKAVHLRIGRLLLESLSPEAVREKLFDVVSHLSAGAELIDHPEERLRVAILNAEAGRKAKASTAFRSAVAYLTTAFQLLPGDPWENEPELAFKIQLDRATCEFMSGDAAEARRLVEELRPRASTRADTAAVYRLKSNIHVAASEIQTAIASLVECLAQMGLPMSLRPSWEEVVAANEEVWALLGDRPIERLVDLPRMTDPDMEAVMNVLGALTAPAYFTNHHLLIVVLCRMVSLSIRHGNTASSAHGYAWYGVMLGPSFKRYREAYAFGQLAWALVERYDLSSIRGKILYIQEVINNWTQPLPGGLELVRRGFHHSLQASDLQIASFCCGHIVTLQLALGHDLEEVYQESVARLAFLRKTSFPDMQSVLIHMQRYVQQLRGLSPAFGSLNGEDFDEQSFEAGLTPARMSTMRCWYWLFKMQARFLSGAYAEAREAGARAAELAWSSLGQIQLLDFHLFRALTLAACHGTMAPEERPQALAALREHQQQLAEWASHQPATFRAPERMVSAELARLTDREGEALRAYEEAHQSAREHGFIQHVALASELAARFWYERKVPTLADTYARKAREAWLRWGARGKVKHLDSEWPHLVSSMAAGEDSTDTDSTQIDALTVVKAQQAISGEIVLERLAATLLRAAIENAGAQRGALLLPRGDKLPVVAVVGTSPEDSATPPDESRLPWTLISYVRRTREHVLIGDASQPHPFSSDAWLTLGRARSVLCLPLLRQEDFRGVLYLENGLTTNAFTPSRLSLLGHLACQAAISIENAQLYAEVQRAEAALRSANDDLEKRVEERTRELKQTQARLVDSARGAGMAEVAANVLHNVGNVLTSAVINLQSMTEMVNASRVGRLKQVSTLLESHHGELADFLTRDPRGTQLPVYLSALGDELLREQKMLQDSMGAMGKHIEHIRAIVQIQQTYARNTLVVEECDLPLLIDDALSIQLPSLERHGISVTRELPPLPRTRLDKHKVVQILVNLISNAKNAMLALPTDQRHLHVQLGAEDNMARIRVVDNGMGIAPELRERLFSQGFTTREGGHGLGLHSSALAAKMLGGSLSLESEGPGKGATAILELPLS
ncbi:trifunctional serine/threonine-protein kinase/ATP-binding protein/sensor histidine kinase [Archangium lipolyticum]|uniref:trifunctional serine/threonine-protein kinase/ATP-binding protein/sensor histidine kinase n=1 Tax=Archangium lipolyticum TaxID=2970465 RepID=UPI002149D806|nr:trifunctional serine/threonine-protein kinase/ATP-binding protein/sensor histidine kinase [Archangium lipolyticum]